MSLWLNTLGNTLSLTLLLLGVNFFCWQGERYSARELQGKDHQSWYLWERGSFVGAGVALVIGLVWTTLEFFTS
jgi:hypothetical protein